MRELSAVGLASPLLRRAYRVVNGNLNWETSIVGTSPEYQQIRGWEIVQGRFIHDGDIDTGAKVVVLGQTVAEKLFGRQDALDAVVRIDNIPFRVVGLLGEGPK